ncbi:MAG: amino acid permease [Selenomonadaceae bacterium]|nr:amino acid permease [Selenomonadaceae bacterium]
MENPNETKLDETGLSRYLSPVAVWALSFGCAVGWGAFVMPGTVFLPIAGPIGTTIGMLIGSLVMLVIGWNYIAMMKKYPDAGGTFSYTKHLFGYDHGFFSAWFLALTYIAILWANATALALIVRNLFGSVSQFGFHYSVAGYDVWLGEILLSDAAIVFFGVLVIGDKRLAAYTQTLFAFLLLGGILIVFGAALAAHEHLLSAFDPPFSVGQSVPLQIFHVAALAPWAFIGFESISHSATGVAFSPKKFPMLMGLSIVSSFLAYTLLTLLAVTELPAGCLTWRSYVASLASDMSGLAGLPTFYAAHGAMGTAGVAILGVAVLGGVVTGLIGMYVAASRLIYTMAAEGILPRWFAVLTGDRTPKNAIFFIIAVSLIVPLFGRTATGGIVDVTTMGATIAYCYTSAAAYASAKKDGDLVTKTTGLLGMIFAALFSLFLLAPEFWNMNALAAESYIILAIWSILGFIVFRFVFNRDTQRRFGRSTVAWITLLFLILISSSMWIKQTTHDMMQDVVSDVNAFYTREMESMGIKRNRARREFEENYLYDQMDNMRGALLANTTIQLLLIAFSLAIMFNIYSVMRRREQEADLERTRAEENSKAKSTFLSNMSHDIRTPMNAIIGYIELAKRLRAQCDDCEICPAGHCDKNVPEKTEEFLEKIDASSKHLLALINDILEMSRIESGKMELEYAPDDLVRVVDDVWDMFAPQMEAKGIEFVVDTSSVEHRYVHFDKNRLNRVLLNLLSNAYKFTPAGGKISVKLAETDSAFGDATFKLHVKDSGIGMTKEFAATVFEAFTQERTSTVSGIQGTGLGMSITKNIIDMMGGTIDVETAPDKGTEFIISFRLRIAAELAEAEAQKAAAPQETPADDDTTAFTGKKLLLADDLDVNREIAKMLLMGAGFEVDTAVNGKEAVDMIAASPPDAYSAILMDIQMPIMNGYEATKAIRALPDGRARIPILAMTASAFSEDVAKAKSTGMDGHIAKPIDIPQMMRTLAEVIKK